MDASRMFAISSFLALLVTCLFYLARFLGHDLRIRRINIFSLTADGLSYSSSTRSIGIEKLGILFHRPRLQAPYWAIITAQNYELKDDASHVSLDQLQAKLWFFPVLFRFTGGPWIEATLDGFKIRIITSKNCPLWIERLRNNLIYTVLNGETIRLQSLKTKLFLSTITAAEGYNDEVYKPGFNEAETQDEIRVQCTASQWYISTWHGRMYSFGDLQAELRRSWVEDRGSFVMIAKESRWLKLPFVASAEQEASRKSSTVWQILHALYSLPSNLVKICWEPLSTIDIYAPRCDITFTDFRLRDAELFHQAATKLKQQYNKYEERYPGIMEEVSWDLFVGAVLSVCQE
ncbi:hypothetical protein GALMADRAFT_365327 [Galerina marginata CBS 339.88]|uniref:Uncharacterized protein n=1 Tax=Galerina marginata (strain CBS 339.88) TaxID=685588 RepID=A0A067TQP0_GALM3|nr:hypothetical protein GALMADRAFT_365327 [Galerina marginata CBS 339.88]